jgi:spore coat polysaccharide biosynthesis predicted glycosyltransferase SpsG
VGPAVKEEHKNKLKALRLPSNYKMEWGPSHEKILKLMESSDLAITAAGNTLYELAILGVPSIVVSHHKRHDDVAKKFAQRKAVVNLGIGTALDPEEISDAVKKLLESEKERETLSMSMKKIVDGLGSKRIMDTVLDLWKRYS